MRLISIDSCLCRAAFSPGRWLRVAAVLFTFGVGPTDLAARQLPPLAPVLDVSNVQGQQVTLSWKAPAGDAPPDLYLLEGGFAPGQVLASMPVAPTASTLTLPLATGAYFARLHAVRAGVRGEASNEVTFGIGLSAPPSTPAALQALPLGNDVVLSWAQTFGGGPTEQLVLDVTGPIGGSIGVPSSGSVLFTGVPEGVYSASIRAVNAWGSSAPSAPVRIVLPWNPVQPLAAPEAAPEAARLAVRYENFATPRLAQFVQRENLAAVVSGASSEFEAILRLKDWVTLQWVYGTPDPYPPWDAMTILDWIRNGITGGFCGQYSQVFLQALAAFGIPARYVEIGTTSNPYNHFATEVWSSDFDKWVLLDAMFNHYFARNGTPLSVLEVRDALLDGTLDEVELVRGPVLEGQPSPLEWPLRTAELYYYVRYHLNANHLSAPHEHPFDRFNDMVEWLDGRTVPWELSEVPSPYPHELLTAQSTGDRSLIEWRPNHVWISSRHTGTMQVTLDLQHGVPSFSHFEYRAIDAAGVPSPWYTTTASSITWPLHPSHRIAEVRGVNVKGIAGRVSSVQLVTP